jgi:hypothetical protein
MEILSEQETIGVFLFVTVFLGGGAAWLAGRAIASTWRPWWHVVFYMFVLGAAVRFIRFALFEGTLLSLPSYLVDTGFLIAVGCLSWRLTRTVQMVTQYSWLYERTGPLTWRERAAAPGGEKSAVLEKVADNKGDFP